MKTSCKIWMVLLIMVLYIQFFRIESKMDAKGMRTLTGCCQCFWRIRSNCFLRWYSMILVCYMFYMFHRAEPHIATSKTEHLLRNNNQTHGTTQHTHTHTCINNNIFWVICHHWGEILEPADRALLFEALSSQAIFNPKSLESQTQATLPA